MSNKLNKARAREREREQKEAAIELPSSEDEGEENEVDESSSEYETDTSIDEDGGNGMRMKPIFVRKEARNTIAEAEAKAAAEAERHTNEQARLAARAERTREMVVEQIKLEAEEDKIKDKDEIEKMPDDTDELDEDAEYQAWKERELLRVVRYREARELLEEEAMQTQRRRDMTKEEREEDDRKLEKLGLKVFTKEKRKLKFLQKYYHKGVFYMDEDSMEQGGEDVRKRKYDDVTGDDKFNKLALPKIMQVKKWGMIGNTKYTHLKDQDTTDYSSGWASNDVLANRIRSKMGGVHGNLDTAGRRNKKTRRL